MTIEKWKNKYIFTEIYEIFFATFTTELQEWMMRLVDFQICLKDEQITQWTPYLIQQLERIDNTITCMVDHWVDSVLGGFVTEFSIKENRSTRLTAEKWKNKYIFTEIYEIFFIKFVTKL